MESIYKQLILTQLKPHSYNVSIYGNEDVSELVEHIRSSGWVKPLVVTTSRVIISGHRRWKALQLLGWETVLVEYREFSSQTAEIEALLLENASRVKTLEQKVREGLAWSHIEREKAKNRQRAAAHLTNQKREADDENTLCENFHTASKGRTTDAIASRVGLGSGRTYSKAVKVVSQIDNEASQGHLEIAQGLRKVLNGQSVDAAYTLLKQSLQERQAIAQVIAKGDAKSTTHARQMLRQDRYIDDSVHPLPSQYQVGDIVFVDIDRQEVVSSQERKWHGFWGTVTQVGELGSLTVNVGSQSLQLFPRDLRPIDLLSNELRQVVRRVLRLRSLELDEIEQKMLDVIQKREWFTSNQLIHLENIEKLYLSADSVEVRERKSAQCRSP